MRPAFALLATLALPLVARAQDGPNPSFNLVNRSPVPITEFYATPSSNDRWGTDRLARFNLPPGQTFPVRLPADGACLYDLRVVYAGRPAEETRRVDVCRADSVTFPGARLGTAGGDTAPPARAAAGNDPSFRLVNRSRAEINEVYASPTGDDQWGQDRLGDSTVAGGSTRVVRLPNGQCVWDVRVVFTDGAALERRKLDLCSMTELRVP